MTAGQHPTRRGVLALLCASAAAHAQPQPDALATRAAIAERSNAYRARQGLAPLRRDALLDAAAQAYARVLAATDRLAHDADGRQPGERASAQGYDWCTVAENVGFEFHSAGFTGAALAQALVDAWIASPPHRAHLMSADVSDVGVGLAVSTRTGRWYGVQLFGRRAPGCRARR